MTRRHLLGLLMLAAAAPLAWLWKRRLPPPPSRHMLKNDGHGQREVWVEGPGGYVYDSFEHKRTEFLAAGGPTMPPVHEWGIIEGGARYIEPPSA